MAKVAVIILNYKLKNDTLEAVYSVLQSDFTDIEVVVVDNNSGDGIEEEVKKIRGLTFIQTGANLGYTGGNNIGIKYALTTNCEYIFILNPDAMMKKDAIRFLVAASQSMLADIVGPKILFHDGQTIWYAGGTTDTNNVGVHRGLDEKDNGQYDTLSETDFVTGAAIFVRRGVFERIGIFDEKYFLYMEDVDFCYRAKKVGIKIVYQPKAVVFHKNAKSTGLGSSRQDYYFTRNRLRFAFKFLPLRTRLALIRHVLSRIYILSRARAFFDFIICYGGKGSY